MGVEGDLIIEAPEQPVEPDGFHAFVSYSHHSDRRTAAWVQKAIESYRVPRQLRRRQPADRPLPARLYPVFRDRLDLRAGASLNETITQALRNSRALIVICSAEAARSPWVTLEIRTFAACHPGAPILAVIAAGDAADDPTPCFPPALLERRDEHDPLIVKPHDPIAADLRRGGDGRRMARLKLVAGLLDVDVFQLARRDDQRRLRRVLLVAALALLVAAVLALALWQAVVARKEAERERAGAVGLIDFMGGDLSKQVESGSSIAISRAIGEKALGWFKTQNRADMTPEQIGRNVRVLWKLGQTQSDAGDLAAAAVSFRDAARSTAGLLALAPNDGQRIFDHAQSVYWVGYADWRLRKLDAAEAAFQLYGRLAARLVQIDPNNAAWQAEIGYAASNLGTLLFKRGENLRAEAAFRKALAVSQRAADAKPGDEQLQFDLAQSHSWVADALARRGRFDEAASERAIELSIYRALSLRKSSTRFEYAIINNLIAKARIDAELNRLSLAIREMNINVERAETLFQSDYENQEFFELLGISILALAEFSNNAGDLVGADQLLNRLQVLIDSRGSAAKSTPSWQLRQANMLLLRSEVSLKRRDISAALRYAKPAFFYARDPRFGMMRDVEITHYRATLILMKALVAIGDTKPAIRLMEVERNNHRRNDSDDYQKQKIAKDYARFNINTTN